MKATELRIGNWIFIDWSKTYRKIDYLDIRDIAENQDFIQMQVKPIPLTPEILEMAGFRLQPQRQAIYIQGRIKLWLGHNGVIPYLKHEDRDDSYFMPGTCQYLHQLQNLFFALTATELEINLNKEK